MNSKCIRHSINKIQSENHRIGTYEINKIYGLALGYQSYLERDSYLNNFFNRHIVLIFSLIRTDFFVNLLKPLSDFWLGIVKLKKQNIWKKKSEELISIAWHSKR